MALETSSAAARSVGGGASANSYIGSLISLTSKSEIRYEGILYNINTEESSIGLCSVRSFGTEGRKKDGPQIPPSDKIYEYIFFRGSDIKDLLVKASPPAQSTPPINSDPAIIQSHYPRPTAPPTSLPAAPTGTLGDFGSHSTPTGLPGSPFQGGLPLYQPGGHMNSWGPAPQNANGSGLAMPMYWQGFYGTPNGLTQLPQQSLLRPPPGLSISPTMQQMQFPGFNSSAPMPPASNIPSSSLDYHSSLVLNSTSFSSLPSSTLPASSLSLNVSPLPPAPLASNETTVNLLPSKPLLSSIPTSTPNSGLPPLPSLSTSTSVPDSAGIPPIASKTLAIPGPGPVALSQPTTSQPVASVAGTSSPVITESRTPSLVTPGQLLQSGPSTASVPQVLQTTQKDVEVVQVSPKPSSGPSALVATEAQQPILPLPPNTQVHKPNAGSYHMRNNYRGRGGRGGSGMSRHVKQFTEDFDFVAMNEKFKKDEVWGHLGKSNRSKSKEGNEDGSEEDAAPDEDGGELPKIDVKPVYNKDDFFDTLSCNALDNEPNHGRTRYSEQMKVDAETFGEFSRYHSGWRGLGPGRGGGRYNRSSYYGRGNGGYGGYHMGRVRGRSMQNWPS